MSVTRNELSCPRSKRKIFLKKYSKCIETRVLVTYLFIFMDHISVKKPYKINQL